MLIYNPPGTTHRDRFHTLDGRFFTISISAASLGHIAEFINPVERATAFAEGHAVALAERLSRECRSWAAGSPLIAEGLCLELMAEMTRATERKHRLPPSWPEAARDLLHDRCPEDIRISEIARAAGVHPIHLARTSANSSDALRATISVVAVSIAPLACSPGAISQSPASQPKPGSPTSATSPKRSAGRF